MMKVKLLQSAHARISVSRSLKKGQGATSKKGNFNARQPISKGQPLDAASNAKKYVSRAN